MHAPSELNPLDRMINTMRAGQASGGFDFLAMLEGWKTPAEAADTIMQLPAPEGERD